MQGSTYALLRRRREVKNEGRRRSKRKPGVEVTIYSSEKRKLKGREVDQGGNNSRRTLGLPWGQEKRVLGAFSRPAVAADRSRPTLPYLNLSYLPPYCRLPLDPLLPCTRGERGIGGLRGRIPASATINSQAAAGGEEGPGGPTAGSSCLLLQPSCHAMRGEAMRCVAFAWRVVGGRSTCVMSRQHLRIH